MKKLLLILLCLPMIGLGQGQSPSMAQETFDINGINTELGPRGFMWDLSAPKHEVPKGGGKHSIFAHEYWMGGVDDGGQLRVAAMTYRQGGNDLWSGPVSDTAFQFQGSLSSWDRVWKINRTQIISHILSFSLNNYIMPEVIENWPAHGDTSMGQAFYLAPFVDADNNGVYNPFLGDYPKIKGDQALYIIRNDVGNIHSESQASPLGIEQHLMFYGYRCIDNPAVNHALFVNMKIFNRGDYNINDFYIGTWLDVDLGYYLDDYVGCNVEKDLGFVYNGDAEDESTFGYSHTCVPVSTPLFPPAQGLVYLNQGMSKFVYYNNDFTVTGNPESGIDFYNYLRGIWKDNVPMTFGGDGHGSGNGATTNSSNYMFPGTSDPAFPGQDWSETTSGNTPADRRFIMSAGPVDLSSGDVFTLDYAFVFAWDSITPGNTGSVDLLFEYVDTIKAVYQDPNILNCNNPGCTDVSAVNYNPSATLDDGSCCYIGGCRDVTAINYDSNALCDDGSCTYIGVELTRLEGMGSGSLSIEIKDASIDDIFNSVEHRILHPTYKKGQGPVDITISDSVVNYPGKYLFKLDNPVLTSTGKITSYGGWSITDSTNTTVIYSSNQSIDVLNKEYIPQLGIYVSIVQQENPGTDPVLCNLSNSLIASSSTLEFDDPNNKWLSGIADRDDPDGILWGLDWIRAGSYTNDNNGLLSDYNQTQDPNGVYETVIEQSLTLPISGFSYTGGTWAPYNFASNFIHGPGSSSSITSQSKLEDLNSVDIVFTDDISKWSRVCIVEAQDDISLSIGGREKMQLRDSPSVDINGNPDLSGTFGMGWFPGYAIDLETGERLNIIFSEDSWLISENGNDMLWNPTENVIDTDTNYLLGGKHFIYVIKGEAWVKGTEDYINNIADCDFSPNYDESAWIYSKLLNDVTGVGRWRVFKNVTWVGAPLLSSGSTIDLTNTANVKLRVTKPYKQYETVNPDKILDKNMDLNLGSNYVVAYENDATTWGGKTVTYDGNSYSPGESFVATPILNFTGSTKARVIEHEALNSFNPVYSFVIPTNPLTTSIFDMGKGNQEEDILVSLYPNPTREGVNIQFKNLIVQNIKINIINIMGELIFSENIIGHIGDYYKNVDLRENAKGIYFIKIETNARIINKKLILQ